MFGYARKAKNLLDPKSVCIEALTDTVGFNDFDSLRLLARILDCAGLHGDAYISLTAGLSVANLFVTHEETEASSDENKTDLISAKVLSCDGECA
jgi:hypothetical protein